MGRRFRFEAEDISRDLDLVVYKLERPTDPKELQTERTALRRELEQLRDRLNDLVRDLD